MYVEEAFMTIRRSSWIAVSACALALAGCNDTASSAPAPAAAASVAGTGAVASGVVAGSVKAQAMIAPLAGQTITGTAMFTQTGADVDLMLKVTGCPPGDHPFHIHAGTACTDATTQMGHWGGTGTVDAPTRGEGTPVLTCGADGTGMVTYKRLGTSGPTQIWNIGGAADSDLVGHVVVIHLPDATRIGCGVITKL
jgi:Cu/Zn superoxide dismutase